MSEEYYQNDVYLNDVTEVKEFLEGVYKDEHPDFVITPVITQFIFNAIIDEYQGWDAHLEPYNSELCDFLKQDRFISFIKNRQPNIAPVPDNVINDVVEYFKNELNNFTPLKVCRNSNHKEDDYLYAVIAKSDSNGSYACWSCFNDSTKSINFGHYNYKTEEEALNMIKEVFYDHTDDMEHFGPESSMTDIPQDKISQNNFEDSESINFRRHVR